MLLASSITISIGTRATDAKNRARGSTAKSGTETAILKDHPEQKPIRQTVAYWNFLLLMNLTIF